MLILDRFEEDYALIEQDDHMIKVNRSQLDDNLKEGDVLLFDKGRYFRDDQATLDRRARIRAMFMRRIKKQ